MNKINKIILSIFLLVGLFTFTINASEIKNPDEVIVSVNNKDLTNKDYYNLIALRSGIDPALSVIDLMVLEEKYADDTRINKIIDQNYQAFLDSLKDSKQSLSDAFALYNANNKEEYIRNSGILVNSYRQIATIDAAYDNIFTDAEKDYIFKNRFSAKRAIYQILIAPEIGLNSSETEISNAQAKALQKAESLSNQVSDLNSFKQLAKENSSDRLNEDGYLGTFDVNQARDAGMEQAIVNAAFALENNSVSKPIKTMFGYVILFVENQSDEIVYNDVKNEIANILFEMYSGHNYNIESYALTLFRKDNKINIFDNQLATSYANFEIEARKAYIQFDPNQYGLEQYLQ